jgi:hypothetical protein
MATQVTRNQGNKGDRELKTIWFLYFVTLKMKKLEDNTSVKQSTHVSDNKLKKLEAHTSDKQSKKLEGHTSLKKSDKHDGNTGDQGSKKN